MWQIAQTNPLSRPSFLITKSLMPEIKKSGNVGFLDSSGSAHDYKWSCKRLQHESIACLNNGLVSGNAQMFLLHMPCAASHVSDHFVAYCAQVPSVCSQN